tara:strand:+ start:216 stop:1139 length:924 start_codon:yes stop_codon:yes gene_type:complete
MKLDKLFHISEKDWYKVISWATIAYDKDKNEISGLATAVPDKDNRYIISDIEILKQSNSGSNTELEANSVTEYKMKYGMKYNNPKMKYVWWHSHHTMEAFWSGTDENEIEAWKNNSFSLALVVNLKQEYKFRVSLWKASGLDIEEHYDTTLNIIRKDGVNVTEGMKRKYKELCSNKSSYVQNQMVSHWNVKGNQRQLWDTPLYNTTFDKVALKDKAYYSEICESIEECMDEFISGEISLKKFKKGLKTIQSKMDKLKITDYKISIPLESKEELLNKLQYTFSTELLEFKDKLHEREYERNENHGWYN